MVYITPSSSEHSHTTNNPAFQKNDLQGQECPISPNKITYSWINKREIGKDFPGWGNRYERASAFTNGILNLLAHRSQKSDDQANDLYNKAVTNHYWESFEGHALLATLALSSAKNLLKEDT